MPRIPIILSQEKLPTSSLQHEADISTAGVEWRALAEGAAKVGSSLTDMLASVQKNKDAADAIDAMSVLTEAETSLADANNELLRAPDYRTHVERSEAAFSRVHRDALGKADILGDRARLLLTKELEVKKGNFLVAARHKQQAMYQDEYRAKLGAYVDFLKNAAMTTDDPALLASALTRLSGAYDVGVAGGLLKQEERENKQEKDLNQIYSLRAHGAVDANPDQFIDDVSKGSWRFIDPVVLSRLTDQANTKSRQRREDARRDGEREEKRVEDAMKAAQTRVVSEGTGKYLDLQKKNATVDEFQAALKAFESESDTFGVDKSSDDYRRVREAMDRPFFSGGVDDPHALNQVKLLVRLGKIDRETQILGYRGRGVSDASVPGLIDLLRAQQREGDISQQPQFKEGRERIMVRIGRGAFSLPGLGALLAPANAAKLEQALDEYTVRGRALFQKDGNDALGRLHDLATEIIKRHEEESRPVVPQVPGGPAKPAKPAGPSSGINRYTPPDLKKKP